MKGKRQFLAVALTGAAIVLTLFAPACGASSNSDASCNTAPWQCGSGTTCWPQCVCSSSKNCTLSNCSLQFACVASGLLTEGETCSLNVGGKSAECSDGLTCASFADAASGTCRPFCDKNQGCAADETCVELTVSAGSTSAKERVCLPPSIILDSGLGVDVPQGGSSGSSGGLPADAWLDIVFDSYYDASHPAM